MYEHLSDIFLIEENDVDYDADSGNNACAAPRTSENKDPSDDDSTVKPVPSGHP